MNDAKVLEVCYALPDKQYLIEIPFNESMTIEDAIIQSGILKKVPKLQLAKLEVGVFSKKKLLTDQVQAGNRIEIYRKLTIDPMESRRIRAEKKRKEQKLGQFGA